MEARGRLGDLIVADDDSAVLDLLARALRQDFTVRTARDGLEAQRLLGTCTPVGLLVDHMMPGLTGVEVLEDAKRRIPGAVRMLMTASSDVAALVGAVNRGEIHRFFRKPLRPVELKKTLVEIVEKARAEELLRVELDTLARIRAGSSSASSVRVTIVGERADLVEAVRAACALRGDDVLHEPRAELAGATLMQRATDLLVLLRGAHDDVDPLVRMAHVVDENLSVVVVDAEPSLERALRAYELGVTDYLAVPLPPADKLSRRLERAALRHVAQRDLKRITSDLIVANRDLAAARRRVEEQQVKVLNAMVRALEARDAYTAGHTDRVAAISVRIGETLRLDSERIERIRVGALLHDIGKIGIRDDVLLKPGRLTPEEFEEIKRHTILGDELLGDIDQFKCVIPVIRGHHEKLDGTGYPDGLKGDQIDIEVRIVSVSDVLDALTSTRPYRPASDVATAFSIMATMEGHHLDREVIDVARELHSQGRLEELLQVSTQPARVG